MKIIRFTVGTVNQLTRQHLVQLLATVLQLPVGRWTLFITFAFLSVTIYSLTFNIWDVVISFCRSISIKCNFTN